MTVAAVVSQLVVYPVSERDILAAREEYAALEAETKEGYENVRHAIAFLRTTRGSIEKRRVELKADALDYGRRVDSVAKKLTTMVMEIEDFLKAMKQAVDQKKEQQKREIEKAEFLALEAKIRAEREAEEAALKAGREVEEARLREEAARLAVVKEQQKAERDQIDAEAYALAELRRSLEAQARAALRDEEERQRLARIAEAQDQPESALAAAAADANDRDPLAGALCVYGWAAEIRALVARAPTLGNPKAAGAVKWSCERLEHVAVQLDTFKADAG